MNHIPKVWLLQKSWNKNIDLSSAQRYGTITPILEGDDIPSLTPGPCLLKLKQALVKEYHPEDYICYALGDPATAFLAGMIFAREGLMRAPVNWLYWDRERDTEGNRTKGGYYVPSRIEYR